MTRPHATTIPIDAVRRRSLSVLRTHQHRSGSFPAALGYPTYDRYCWFRDGAFVADALSRTGDVERATRFHQWCRDVIDHRTQHIADLIERARTGSPITNSEMLPTRYTLDSQDGTDEWWDFQLDGYGTWLWSLAEHCQRHPVDLAPFLPAIETTVRYLDAFGDRPCFDWWEESEEHQHVSTLTSIVAGLEAAASLLDGSTSAIAAAGATRIRTLVDQASKATGHLTKWVGSTTVDGSLLAAATSYGYCKPGSDLAEATYRKILTDLVDDGVHRYRGDTFYGGGEWINLTAWLGWYEAETGRIDLAFQRRDWIAAQATPEGDLPEQVATNAQAPDRIAEWEKRWGTVATPLLWSHAMFLTLDHILQPYGHPNDPQS